MIALRTTRRCLVLFICAWPLLVASCSQDTGRYPVQGEVSFDGEPIDKGAIVFQPVTGGGIKTGGPIENGRYDIPAETGPPAGKHKVLLFWEKKTGTTYVDRDSGDVYDRRAEGLPGEYQSDDTPLSVEISDGPNVHDFRLTSPAKP
ncbi:MAG: hypothetical protein AB7F89_16895 [Pirellulaceae bacterium]